MNGSEETTMTLPSGHIVLLDAKDLPLLDGYVWFAERRRRTVYVRGRKHGEQGSGIYLHALLLPGARGQVRDHINGNGLDNRRINLRLCLPRENNLNAPKKRDYRKFKGVYQNRSGETYFAEVVMGGKKHRSGGFSTPEQAATAYDDLARKHHGEFARLNFPLTPTDVADAIDEYLAERSDD